MIAVDTNVVVRLLVGDDTAQAKRARQLFADNQILLVVPVILETEWVLRGAYGFGREAISGAFRKLFGLQQVTIDQLDSVAAAMEAYGEGLDFADALHLAVAAASNAEHFATFDRALVARAGGRFGQIVVTEV